MSLAAAWTALRHGGNLLSPQALDKLPARDRAPSHLADRLRGALVDLPPDGPATGEALSALLDLVLGAGADPNMRNYEGQPLYFSSYLTLPKLEMLAKHGADFTALETTRDDRRGWTGAMFPAMIRGFT